MNNFLNWLREYKFTITLILSIIGSSIIILFIASGQLKKINYDDDSALKKEIKEITSSMKQNNNRIIKDIIKEEIKSTSLVIPSLTTIKDSTEHVIHTVLNFQGSSSVSIRDVDGSKEVIGCSYKRDASGNIIFKDSSDLLFFLNYKD